MGAYENPRIIQQPDYGEIFRRNFQQGYQQMETIFARAQARRDKLELEQDKRLENILQMDRIVNNIDGGDMSKSLQRTGRVIKETYADCQNRKKDMAREDYDNCIISSMNKLDELKSVGVLMQQQSDALKDMDISAFNSPGYKGLLDAWGKREIDFQYVGDDLEIYYKVKDPITGEETVNMIDMDALKDEGFMNLNERYEISEDVKKDFMSSVQITEQIINEKTGITKQAYADGNTRSSYISKISKEDKVLQHFAEVEDAASIFVDNIYKTTDPVLLKKAAEKKAKEYGLKGEQYKNFVEMVENGEYNDVAFSTGEEDGRELSYRKMVDEISAEQLVGQAFDQYAPALKRTIKIKNDSPQGSGFGQEMRDDLATTKAINLQARVFAGFSKSPEEISKFTDEDKQEYYKSLVNELKKSSVQNASKIDTHDDLYKKWLGSDETDYTMENYDSVKAKKAFNAVYGDPESSPIFYNQEPLPFDISDDGAMFDLYLQIAPVSADVKNYYTQQYLFEKIEREKYRK